MRVVLGTFARSGLEAISRAGLEASARDALVHFAAKLQAGRRTVAPPRFLSRSGPPPTACCELEVSLDEASEEALRHEAGRRGIDLEELGSHAVMIYLAEREYLDASLKAAPAPFGPEGSSWA